MDVFTLFFVEASILVLLGLTMMASSIGHHGKSGNYWFAASNFCGAISLLLHYAGPTGPLLIIVVLANLFFFIELTFINKAVAEFTGRGRGAWLYLLALSVLMTLATARYTLYPENHNLRIDFISVVAIATAASSAALMFHSLRNEAKFSASVMSALFSIYTVTNSVRLFTVWRFPHQSFYHIWLDRTVIVGLSFCFLWMTNARLRSNLETLASTDSLTGVLNRRALQQQIERIFLHSRERKSSIAALMLDVDRFKEINDSYGHHAGDLALRAIADCLRHVTRAGDVIARLGGDEFLIIMPGADTAQAQLVASRIKAHLSDLRIPCDASSFGVQVSMGIIALTSTTETVEDVLKLGDSALYAAKATGRPVPSTAIPQEASSSLVLTPAPPDAT